MRMLVLLFVLTAGVAPGADLQVAETAAAITITRGTIPVLTYHKAEVDPPEGVDPVFRRSGFIHPLCAPSGAPVTGIHPKDHAHHLGLWHAWVKTGHGKDKPDFWNLRAKTGRVRHARTVSILDSTTEDPAVGFVVEQEHVAYKGDDRKETVVLRELLEVKAEHDDGQNVVSYVIEQENVSGETLRLPAYRYGGGLAFRGPHDWDRTNSDYLTSEGLDRANSHATRAKWVMMHGPTAKGVAAVAVLIAAGNRDFPNRIRTWPAKTNNGAVFFNVVPTQEHAWEIKPGEKAVMAYLLVVTDRKPAAGEVNAWWEAYAGKK
ncbi:MAG: hypothetical protein HKO57_14650 [Akkermansiaceae bacterium]|nr:hypothetical protein [Akkermansiaceae bacterium]